MSAADYLPEDSDLASLRMAAAGCKGCPLYLNATQTVFGEGIAPATLMLVGEQPGDQEDRAGHPFIGPAGKILDKALAEAGIMREQVYITNTVKHFRYSREGEKRKHVSPGMSHIHACKPWLESEIAAVKPQFIVCLGATATRSLLGSVMTLKIARGSWHEHADAKVTATYHPSAILRVPLPEGRKERYQSLVSDLRHVAEEQAHAT